MSYTVIEAQTASATSIPVYIEGKGTFVLSGLTGTETGILQSSQDRVTWAAITATASATIQHINCDGPAHFRVLKSQTTASVGCSVSLKGDEGYDGVASPYKPKGRNYATWSPRFLPGVTHWYDAGDEATITEVGGKVSQWNDKSGWGNHAIQTSGAKQPTYNLSATYGAGVAYSAGNSLSMMYHTSISGKAKFICLFASYGTEGVGSRFSLFEKNAGSTPDGYSGLALQRKSNDYMHIYPIIDGSAYGSDATTEFSAPNHSMITIMFDSEGNKKSYGVNGVIINSEVFTGSYSAKVVMSNPYRYLGNLNFDGVIYELVMGEIYNEDYGRKVEGYLAHKWGIALPAAHPYRLTKP